MCFICRQPFAMQKGHMCECNNIGWWIFMNKHIFKDSFDLVGGLLPTAVENRYQLAAIHSEPCLPWFTVLVLVPFLSRAETVSWSLSWIICITESAYKGKPLYILLFTWNTHKNISYKSVSQKKLLFFIFKKKKNPLNSLTNMIDINPDSKSMSIY